MRTMKQDVEEAVTRWRERGESLVWIAKRLGVSKNLTRANQILNRDWRPVTYSSLRKMWLATFSKAGAPATITAKALSAIDAIPVDNHGPYEDPIVALDAECQIRLAYWDDHAGAWKSCDGVDCVITHGIEFIRPRLDNKDVPRVYGQSEEE